MKYKGNLSTKLLFLQNVENALTTFLHSTDGMCPDIYPSPRALALSIA